MADQDQESAPLRSTTTKSGYTLPAIWSFPPFFTIQPNPSTAAHQLALWSELILGWARHDRVFAINCDSPNPGAVFANDKIGRELMPDHQAVGASCATLDAALLDEIEAVKKDYGTGASAHLCTLELPEGVLSFLAELGRRRN